MSLRVTQGIENARYGAKLDKYHPDNPTPIMPIELTSSYMTPEQLASFEPSLPGVYVSSGYRLHKLAAEHTAATTSDPHSLTKAPVASKVGQKTWVTDLGRTLLATGPGH